MSEEHSVISSLIVESLVADMDRVAAALAQIDGVEVHGKEDGQVVITIERESLEESHELANTLTQLDGVTGVNLIYANFEDDERLQSKFEALHPEAAADAGDADDDDGDCGDAGDADDVDEGADADDADADDADDADGADDDADADDADGADD